MTFIVSTAGHLTRNLGSPLLGTVAQEQPERIVGDGSGNYTRVGE